MVSFKVYVVVVVGLTDGLDTVELKPDGFDVQLYVSPVTETEPICWLLPEQRLWLLPTFAVGCGFTVIITEFDLVHPVAVIVSVSV